MSELRRKARRVAEITGIPPRWLGSRPELFEELAQMRAGNDAAPAPFKGGPIWRQLARRFDYWFAMDGINAVEDHEMNGQFSSPPPGNPKLLRYACWMLYRDIKRRDELGLLDRIEATADERGPLTFRFDGRLMSWDLLISIDTIYSMAEVDPRILTGEVIVGDLGAGWGRIGHVLRQANPRARYVVFDLPEVLLVSQTHLPRRLPADTVSRYQDMREGPITRERLAADLTFLGAHDLERVADGALDFMVNIGSFQEMSPAQVAAYFAIIDRTTNGILYTQQLWSAGTHSYCVGEISDWGAYPWLSHWIPALKRNASWSDLYFEAAFRVGASRCEAKVDKRVPQTIGERFR